MNAISKIDFLDSIAAILPKEQATQLAALVFIHSHNGILITDAQRNTILVNAAFTEITGYSLKEVYKQNPRILKSSRHDREFYQNMWANIMRHGYWQGQIWDRRKNGTIFPLWQTIHAVRDAQNNITNFFSIFSDFTDSKQQEDKIQRLQQYDALTGLPNRVLLQDRLDFILATAKSNNSKVAVIAVNIDRLAIVNTSFGFIVGDKLLELFSHRLQQYAGEQAIVGRFAGDTFLIIMPNIKNANHAAVFARELLKFLQDYSYPINEEALSITASIGICIYPDDNAEFSELINGAHVALKSAKNAGGNTFNFYIKAQQTSSTEFLLLESKLHTALKKQELFLNYQPQIDVVNGSVIGIEALVRWHHPDLGIISPNKFIPIAEESGLIIPLTEWILQTACMEARRWQVAGFSKITLAVNVAALNLQSPDFLQMLTNILHTTQCDPTCLELEITERSILELVQKNSDVLVAIKKLGCSIAIDDFGTGYSSLNYLAHFPIDKIKIDISFIKNIVTDRETAAVVQGIIMIAKNLSMQVIAEGVENHEQFIILRAQNIDQVQGFYFCQPLSAEELFTCLRTNAWNNNGRSFIPFSLNKNKS